MAYYTTVAGRQTDTSKYMYMAQIPALLKKSAYYNWCTFEKFKQRTDLKNIITTPTTVEVVLVIVSHIFLKTARKQSNFGDL